MDNTHGGEEHARRSRHLKARDDVVARRVEDEMVLYDPVREKMHVLNATAGFIWDQLDGRHTFDELVESTRVAFDPPAPVDVVARDVSALIAELTAKGLLG